MTISGEISKAVFIIPVTSKEQAVAYCTKYNRDAIIYHLTDEDQLYVHFSEKCTSDKIEQFKQMIKINVTTGELLDGLTIEQLSALNENLSFSLVLKQAIICDYLNGLSIPFVSTNFFGKGKQYLPPYPWKVHYPVDGDNNNGIPLATQYSNLQVVMQKPFELIFKNCDGDFNQYFLRLNRMIKMLTYRSLIAAYYVYSSEGVTLKETQYWCIIPKDYHLVFAAINGQTPLVATLKELCASYINHNAKLFLSAYKRQKLPQELRKELPALEKVPLYHEQVMQLKKWCEDYVSHLKNNNNDIELLRSKMNLLSLLQDKLCTNQSPVDKVANFIILLTRENIQVLSERRDGLGKKFIKLLETILGKRWGAKVAHCLLWQPAGARFVAQVEKLTAPSLSKNASNNN